MAQLKGFVVSGEEHMGCHLMEVHLWIKTFLKQWYIKSDQTIRKFGFEENEEDNCIYAKSKEKESISSLSCMSMTYF